MTPAPPRILCVDDEPNVLEGLKLSLRRRGEILTAPSGVAALELLRQPGFSPPAVIISDMRMPQMDGAAFLSQAGALFPDAVRVLLTGQTDLEAAIAAVNEGHIFRFLTKPCPQPVLLAAIDAAVTQHELLTSERVLLTQTLHGSIKALTDVLSLTSPLLFGRATRMKELVGGLAQQCGMAERWQVEVAAMLSQLGAVALPAEVAEKHYYGQPLTPDEASMVARVPAQTEQLIGQIPRLEVVRGMLKHCAKPYRPDPAEKGQELIQQGGQLLRVALDFDLLQAGGSSADAAIAVMRGRSGRYDPAALSALAKIRGGGDKRDVREVTLRGLRAGMILLDDLKLATGAMLVARGFVVSETFIARCANFRPGVIKEPLRVVVPQ